MKKMLIVPVALLLSVSFAYAGSWSNLPNSATIQQTINCINNAVAVQQAQIGQVTAPHSTHWAAIGQTVNGATNNAVTIQDATILQGPMGP